MSTALTTPEPEPDDFTWGGLTYKEATAGHGSHAKVPGWWAALWLRRFVEARFPELLDDWDIEDNDGRPTPGRRPLVRPVVFLVLSMLLILEGQPVNPVTVSHMLEHRLSAAAKAALGIEHLYTKGRDFYHVTYRGMHRIIDLWDGWVAPKQLMEADERAEIRAKRDAAHTARMAKRGVIFTSKLIDLVINLQPEEHQRSNIALSVDQTSMRAGSQRRPWKRDKNGNEIRRWNLLTGEEISRPVLELEAGLYPMEKGAAVKNPGDAKTFVKSDWQMVYVANLIVDTREDPTSDHTGEPPNLIRAGSLGTPNIAVGEATLELLDSIQSRGYTITRLTFDRGYNYLMSGGFHRGLRDRGIPNVQDYMLHQKGISNGVGGSKFVEGDYYCPGTAPDLLNATVRYDSAKGDITERQWQADVEERHKFALHLHDIKANGKVRLSCPALGPAASVYCPLREVHARAFRGKAEPGQVHEENIPKRWSATPVCCQDTITIDPNDHIQEQQLLRYGSTTHTEVYRADRNTIESVNDKLKSDFALDHNMERRMRGLAANQYVLAFKIAGLNFKRIANHARDHLKRAEQAERAGIVTPIRPDVQVTVPNSTRTTSTPADSPEPSKTPKRKLRSRDRNGWSDYRRNPKPIISVTEPPKNPTSADETAPKPDES